MIEVPVRSKKDGYRRAYRKIAGAQARGRVNAVVVMPDGGFDISECKSNGVDIATLLISMPETDKQALGILLALCRSYSVSRCYVFDGRQ